MLWVMIQSRLQQKWLAKARVVSKLLVEGSNPSGPTISNTTMNSNPLTRPLIWGFLIGIIFSLLIVISNYFLNKETALFVSYFFMLLSFLIGFWGGRKAMLDGYIISKKYL